MPMKRTVRTTVSASGAAPIVGLTAGTALIWATRIFLARQRRPRRRAPGCSGRLGAGQHRAADLPGVEAEARNEFLDGAGVGIFPPGDQDDVIDEPGEEAAAGIAVAVRGGDDHHVEMLGLGERQPDVLVLDPKIGRAS